MLPTLVLAPKLRVCPTCLAAAAAAAFGAWLQGLRVRIAPGRMLAKHIFMLTKSNDTCKYDRNELMFKLT
jgi:hypothetical protein